MAVGAVRWELFSAIFPCLTGKNQAMIEDGSGNNLVAGPGSGVTFSQHGPEHLFPANRRGVEFGAEGFQGIGDGIGDHHRRRDGAPLTQPLDAEGIEG